MKICEWISQAMTLPTCLARKSVTYSCEDVDRTGRLVRLRPLAFGVIRIVAFEGIVSWISGIESGY
jgi:hypothetical protein